MESEILFSAPRVRSMPQKLSPAVKRNVSDLKFMIRKIDQNAYRDKARVL